MEDYIPFGAMSTFFLVREVFLGNFNNDAQTPKNTDEKLRPKVHLGISYWECGLISQCLDLRFSLGKRSG